jgi:hypothetical protein
MSNAKIKNARGYISVGVASEARVDKIAKNIEFLILKEI